MSVCWTLIHTNSVNTVPHWRVGVPFRRQGQRLSGLLNESGLEPRSAGSQIWAPVLTLMGRWVRV